MHIDILSLFPEMFTGPFSTGIFQRAVTNGLVSVAIHNFRENAHDKHHTVDDYPFGGGAGMVLKPEPLFATVESLKTNPAGTIPPPVILLTPQGRLFSQTIARHLAEYPRLILVCGHYEGIDERVRRHLVSDEISIGDYVLSGGELAAMVVVDSVVRLVPGVMGSAESAREESHSEGLLEYPQYTRPAVFRGLAVPDILLSGNHGQIARWRRQESLRRTFERRPDLLGHASLSEAEKEFLKHIEAGPAQEDIDPGATQG
jgi:tRNA (guanine37-N1)-methyltransferase